jgi:hypothetical protein
MKLFTAEIDKKLFAQYLKGSDLANQVVVAKIFNPYGRGTWYLLNSDPEDPEYLWAIVDLGDIEVGSVNRSDLENIRIKPFMLGLERDLSFTPMNAAEIYRGLNSGKTYATGGGVGDYKLKDVVDFYYGRADEKKVVSGTITDILNDGYTISTGFTQVMVKPNEIVGYTEQAEPKKKRFGIFKDGGGIGQENKEMVLNNNNQIAHHVSELIEAVKNAKDVPAWVVAKVYRAASDLSDITHYLEGEGKSYGQGGGVEGVDLNDWDMPVIRTQFEDEEYEFEKGGEITENERMKSLKNYPKLKF